jgi:diacylglycerol kinase (ATP)
VDVALVVGSQSRKGAVALERARAHLQDHGATVVFEASAAGPKAVKDAVLRAMGTGAERVVVGGGDGTVRDAAGVLLNTGVALAVLPLGTGNVFARDLGVPKDLAEACRIAVEGEVAAVDVARAGQRVFVNLVAVGLSHEIASALWRPLKLAIGPLAYLPALATALQRQRPFDLRLETPDGQTVLRALQVGVGCGRHHAGPFLLAPDASQEDGMLDVVVIGGAEPLELAQMLVAMRSGAQGELPHIWTTRTSAVRLVTDPPLQVRQDGELGGRTPVEVTCLPGALTVVRAPLSGEEPVE